MLFLYGCVLREKGHALAWKMDENEEVSASAVAAVLREAAGIFQYLNDVVHKNYDGDLPANRWEK